MLYYLHGLIFGLLTRDYGNGFKVQTFVGEAALNCLMVTGVLPTAVNDNAAAAA
ncbi:hypothetical protein [Sphingomonas sp. ACRSK]|uniref:hypothetical protein n=1 Tax=Sphingomonas sp. ACRSK TaxID=2918213 RepID=UPI001EF3FB1C|nr:hypothetical protein [Sphingomonas sp. ACRSK]MCG7348865.1 hypothetical protein [Sphingomonas sp. ACRSK]